jgi:hypothetical protein
LSRDLQTEVDHAVTRYPALSPSDLCTVRFDDKPFGGVRADLSRVQQNWTNVGTKLDFGFEFQDRGIGFPGPSSRKIPRRDLGKIDQGPVGARHPITDRTIHERGFDVPPNVRRRFDRSRFE